MGWAARRACALVSLALASLLVCAPLSAQTITTSGPPDPLAVRTAMAGRQPDDAVAGGSTYSVVVSAANQKITGQLDTPMPAGTTLRVTLGATSGAVSSGTIALDTSPRDLVTGLQIGSFTNLTITYRLDATTTAGRVSLSSRTVTLRIVAGP